MDRIVVINMKHDSTREIASTVDKEIGENVLKKCSKNRPPAYAGYIIVEGKIAPQWRLNGISINLDDINHELQPLGYIAKIV